MSIGGLVAKAVLLKDQMDDGSCERCGLTYDQSTHSECPHCADLNDLGLANLRKRIDQEHRGNKAFGRRFYVIAAVIGVLLLVSLID